MLYVRCTGRRMNENDAREVFKVGTRGLQFL